MCLYGEEMITEGYFAKVKDYPETDWLICIARKYPWFVKKDKMSHFPSLAPSQELLDDYKSGFTDWGLYGAVYRKEIATSEQARRDIAWIGIKDCQGETVRLMCWEKKPPCHRFILLDIIEKLGEMRK